MNRSRVDPSVARLSIWLLAVPSVAAFVAGCGGQSTPPDGFAPIAVFIADRETDGVDELYAVDAAGTECRKLSGTLVAGGDVRYFYVSPNRDWVAYSADQDSDEVIEIYLVPVTGGTSVKLSGPMVSGGDFRNFGGFAPDSSLLMYAADQDTDGVTEIYSVRLDGSGRVKLNAPLVAGGSVGDFSWAPDGSRIVYDADQETDEVVELFSVRPDGADNTKISGALVSGGDVDYFLTGWAPDSSRIVYTADEDIDGVVEVFSVRPDGSGRAKLNAPLPAGRGVPSPGFYWSPDSSRVAYWVDQDVDNVYEIYSVRPDGSQRVKLNGPLAPGGIVSADPRWSLDGSRIAYTADQDVDEVTQLYSVRGDGTGRVRLNPALVAGGDVVFDEYFWAPDSSRMVYRADQSVDEVFEIYSVNPTNGTDQVKLNGPMVAGGDVQVFSLQWLPDSARVLYLADQEVDGVAELYCARSDGSQRMKLNGPLVSGGNVTRARWASDGGRVVYLADQDTDETFELYAVQPDGLERIKLAGGLVAFGDVRQFLVF